jgi:hypothetical protein
MADAKIEIKVGTVSFIGEGGEKWLSEQLDKMLEKLPELAQVAPASADDSGGNGDSGTRAKATKAQGTLANLLREKNATTNQVRKFLATAIWVIDRGKRDRIATADVSKALSDNHQKALGNPADCLNKNVSKGFCEKVGKEFFVTDDGRTEIG